MSVAWKWVDSLSANPTKWSNTLQQFVGNSLSVFDHFVWLSLEELIRFYNILYDIAKLRKKILKLFCHL